MTREEEIKKAARSYVSGDTLSNQSILIHFANGADWADLHPKNVWHDASEMPKEGEWILIQIDDDTYDALVLCDIDADMHCAWCKKYGVIRWAYIADLLP